MHVMRFVQLIICKYQKLSENVINSHTRKPTVNTVEHAGMKATTRAS